MSKLPLSVVLITFNEEANLPRTLKAIMDIAEEIIIVDSHSTDSTLDVANSFGAKVFIEDWKGHIEQKNSALEKCNCEWILSLDADEVVTDELLASIKNAISKPKANGYFIDRKTVYLGKKLNHMWQPDKKLRLVKRSANPKWGGYNPHDKLFINGKTLELTGDLLHYSYKDLLDHWKTTLNYAHTVASSYHQAGKRFSYLKLFFNPLFGFTKSYIFRAGFLDGFTGLLAATSKLVYIFLKYAFLWEIEQKGKE